MIDMTTSVPPAPVQAYDPLTRALHWATAGIVLLQFAMGETWSWFGAGWKGTARDIHTSIGFAFAVLLLFRLYWLFARRRRTTAGPADNRLAILVHLALYALLVAETMAGFEWRWSGTRPLFVFGAHLTCVPCRLDKTGHHIVATLHNYGAWTIMALAFGHAAAALWRHYVRRDGILGRMLPATRRA